MRSRPTVTYEAYLLLFLHVLFAVLGSKVPSYLNVVDIAGLVKGAHEGQGLGNAFLSHIRACDAVFHMTRESLVAVPIVLVTQSNIETCEFVSMMEILSCFVTGVFLPVPVYAKFHYML